MRAGRQRCAVLPRWCAHGRWLLCVALLTGLAACGDDAPVHTTLSALKAGADDYDGREVVVSGTVRTFPSPRHYWIENPALDRVALEGRDDLAQRVGEEVEVQGRFAYDRDKGRRIRVETLRVLH